MLLHVCGSELPFPADLLTRGLLINLLKKENYYWENVYEFQQNSLIIGNFCLEENLSEQRGKTTLKNWPCEMLSLTFTSAVKLAVAECDDAKFDILSDMLSIYSNFCLVIVLTLHQTEYKNIFEQPYRRNLHEIASKNVECMLVIHWQSRQLNYYCRWTCDGKEVHLSIFLNNSQLGTMLTACDNQLIMHNT